MSNTRWHGSQQVCATCAFWTGYRKPEFGRIVEVPSSERGRCHGGRMNNCTMNGSASCPGWEVWAPVR